jgi:hypothetical protein
MLLLTATLSGLLGCAQELEPVESTVIILVLDGVRTSESFGEGPSDAAGTDHPSEVMPESWEALVPRAARAEGALNGGVTITTTAHAALTTGRRLPFGHYELDDGQAGLYLPTLPGLPEVLQATGGFSREQIQMVANTLLLCPVSRSLWPWGADRSAPFSLVEDEELGYRSEDDADVLASAEAILSEAGVRLLISNLHQADRDGHYGAPEDYGQGVREQDAALVDFYRWLSEDPRYAENTWVFIVADHGRHTDATSDPPWKSHGDACWGCRHVPLLVLGPGVREGITVSSPVLLTDLAPTAAALLGVALPWADGRVARELFDTPPDGSRSRSGVAERAVAGGRVAEVLYQDDPEHRKVLRVDGEQLSASDALSVEGVSLASGPDRRDWLCFRELRYTPGEDMPWRPRCMVDAGAGWQELPELEEDVGAFWSPVLSPDEEGVWVLYTYNPHNYTNVSEENPPASGRVKRFTDGGWHTSSQPLYTSFPTGNVGLKTRSGALMLAAAVGDGGVTARSSRMLITARLTPDGSDATWGDWQPLKAAELFELEETDRLEQPALTEDEEGHLRIAALAHTEDGTGIVVATQDSGQWRSEGLLDIDAAVDPHLPPRWSGDRVLFHTVDTDEASLCSAAPEQQTRCHALGTPRVLGWTLDGDTAHLIVDRGVAEWEPLDLSLTELGLI